MAKIQATMSTEIALDMLQASDSIKRITQLVNSATNAWKAQENQMRATGDYLGAAQAKYDGLGNAIQQQQAKIEKLQKEQSELKGNTVETAEQYLKYQQQIDQATTKLASMEAQQQKAKSSMDYYKSGLADLQKEYKQQIDSSETYIKRLQAEGKEDEVKQEKLKLLKNSVDNLNKQYEAQENMLKKVAAQSGEASDEYRVQKKRLDETATSLANAKTNVNNYKSGLTDLQKEYKQQNSLSESYIKRLEAEGKEEEAKQKKLKLLKSSVINLNKQYEAQVDMLRKISAQGNGNAYVKQKQRINETATALANAKSSMNKLNDEISQSQKSSTFIGRLKDNFSKLNQKVDDTAEKTSRLKGIFSATFAANVISNGFQNILGGVKGKIDELILSSGEYVKYQQTMNATWLTLTGNAEEGKKMVDMTNEMAQAAANSTEMVDGMNQKLYSVTHNVESTKAQTQAILTLQDAFGQTDAAVENFTIQWAQMIANGKVQGQDMMSIINVFPEMKNQLKEVAAETYGISDMTTEKYSQLQSQGKITAEMAQQALLEMQEKYKNATENFSGTIGGMERTLNSRMPAIIAAFRDPIDKMKNPFLGKISEWVADPSTETRFSSLGDKVAKGLSTITDAFAKAFNLGDGTDKLNSFMDKLGEFVEKTSNKIAKNAPKIVSTLKDVKDGLGSVFKIGKAFGEGAWEAIKGIIEGIASAFDKIGKNSKNSKEPIKNVSGALGEIAKHEEAIKTVGKLFVGYFVAEKTISGVTKVVRGVQGIAGAFGLLRTASSFLTANPFVLAIAGITALVAGFVLLYKHNKKFREFCDGIAKSVKDGIGSAIKWVKDKIDSVSKKWKKFKKSISDGIDNVVKSTVGSVGDLKNGISKKNKEIKKSWDKHWDKTKEKASKTWDGIKDNAKESTEKLAKTIREKHDEIHDKWSKTWKKSKNYLSDKWDEINDESKKKFGKDFKDLVFDNLGKIGDKFQEIWDKIHNGFSELWSGLKRLAGDGINAVIKIPNDGIDGINDLIHDFGGPKEAIKKIPKVKFATGTGYFNSSYRNPITRPTLATLNDGNDSPETNNQEMVIFPNGKAVLPQGKDVQMLLPAGTEVLNASELAMLAGLNNRQAFAKGTGFWSKIWNTATSVASSAWNGLKDGVDKFTKMLSFITDAVTDPTGTLAKKFSPNADKLDGVFGSLGNALYKKPIETAKSWWSELWSMAKEKSSPEIQVGAIGDDYQFKDRVADSGVDPWGYFFKECVSFVASRLSNQGVNASLFSGLGNGNMWLDARVPHSSTPRPGMIAVYAKNGQNHVSTVSGVSGSSFSGEEYNYAGSHAYHAFANRPISQVDTFLDFGVQVADKAKEENSPLRKLIKSQVGGMFDWISKILAPLNGEGGGSLDNPQGGNVERWREYVIKALKANGLQATAHQVNSWMKLIQRESNGDPQAINLWDSNAKAGHPSKGLAQTIDSTFNAYKFAGHDDIYNGYDNLLAAINYMKHRYGTSDAAFTRVASYGYANGGLVSKNGVYELAEGDMPEYVIPTDIAKRGRAWQLLSEAVSRFAGEAPQDRSSIASGDSSLAKLEAKFDTVISLLSQLVANGANPIEIRNIIDGQGVANSLAPYMSTANANYERRQALLGGEII